MLYRLWRWINPPFGQFRYYTYIQLPRGHIVFYWYWKGRRSQDYITPFIWR